MKSKFFRYLSYLPIKLFKPMVSRLFTSLAMVDTLIAVLQHLGRNNSFSHELKEKNRWLGFLFQMKEKSYSQISQDLWVLYRTGMKVNGFFVEVGSCHPTNLNNTYLLESSYKWNGVLIEPNPRMAELLRTQRTSAVLEFAVAEGEYIQLALAQNPEFSSTVDQLSQNKHKLHEPTGEIILAKCSSLTDLLTQASCPQTFDFLSLDIEGGELYALTSLDFSRFRPKLIAVEHNFTQSRKYISDYLKENDFVLDPLSSSTVWDDWYIDRNFLKSLEV
jgi:FkbM family methyltransferase